MAASVLSAPMASIGVPKEIKLDEQRVALTPDAVRELVSQGLEAVSYTHLTLPTKNEV